MIDTIKKHRFAVVIVASFAILATIYSIVTPIFEASDEFLHYPLVEHLATEHTLPVQVPGVRTLWDQEGSQPPLYYGISAVLTSWIDTSDLEDVLWRNPHGKLGVPGDPDNKNIVIHTPQEKWPWHGTVLAVHLIRLVSVALGTASVALVCLLVHTIWPDRRWMALLAAALTAFNPMFLFITGSVNNDNLMILLGTWTLLLTTRLLTEGLTTRRAITLAVVLTLGTLTKVSGVTLVPLVGLALLIHGWHKREWRQVITAGLVIGFIWLVLAGWWYLRNLQLYGELFGTHTMVQIAGPREAAVSLWQLGREWYGFWVAYWGLFGGVSILADPIFYQYAAVISWIAVGGLVWWIVQTIRHKRWRDLLLPGLLAAQIAITFAALINWTMQTYGSQGRLMFPVIGAISGLMALGLLNWLPEKCRPVGAGMVGVPLLAAALIAPFRYIAPAYALPPIVAEVPASAVPIGLTYNGLEIVAVETGQSAVSWNDRLEATVYLRANEPVNRNYSLYLNALGRQVEGDYQLLGKIDTWPGGGSLPTTAMEPGVIYQDRYAIHLKRAGDLPAMIRLAVGAGIFEEETYTILSGQLADGSEQTSAIVPDGAAYPEDLAACDSLVPQTPAVEATIGGFARLRANQPMQDGYVIPVRLVWDRIEGTQVDWTVFVHLVDETGEMVTQADGPPLNGDYPTSKWLAACQFEDVHFIALPEDIEPGTYSVLVGMYDANDPAFTRAPAADLDGTPYPNAAIPLGAVEVER